MATLEHPPQYQKNTKLFKANLTNKAPSEKDSNIQNRFEKTKMVAIEVSGDNLPLKDQVLISNRDVVKHTEQ
jgi:hypothetical protein